MADRKRKELIDRLQGSLPRYALSDDKDEQTSIPAQDIALAVKYLNGEA